MKFLHISDLHFGKTIHNVNLIESGDQPAWVEKFIDLVKETKPDAVVISGDIYDRGSPAGEAYDLLDCFFTQLAELETAVFVIAGNHDSGQRLAYGKKFLESKNIHIVGKASKEVCHVTLPDPDGYGPVTFWLLPYVYPAIISQLMENENLNSYSEAIRALLEAQDIDFSARNVILTHQNVTANGQEGARGGSESMVGGVGQVDYSTYDGFDYVALGHIHSAYHVGRDEVRYCGTPLCYHFDEVKQSEKGPLLVELGEKGSKPVVTLQKIAPLHPMISIEGTQDQCEDKARKIGKDCYVRIVIKDCAKTPELMSFFTAIVEDRGSKLLVFDSEFNAYNRVTHTVSSGDIQNASMDEIFAQFYANRLNGESVSNEDKVFIQRVMEVSESPEYMDVEHDEDNKYVRELLNFVMGQEGTSK